MIKKYLPNEIEPKWQERWAKNHLYSTDFTKPKKFYVLAEFTYPSGDLHMGHWFTFVGADIYARFKRMQGFNVFFPNGFDSFGLPAENAAIKRGVHPQDWTMANIERMKGQFSSMGASFSFDHEVITALPEYYKWNQWIFLKMLEKGLAYRGKYLSNWCPVCQTVLANEGVEGGACWRCGTEVEQKEVGQWFFKITSFADRLIWPENPTINWPKSLREAQNSWIGKSEGALIKFSIINDQFSNDNQSSEKRSSALQSSSEYLEVFTTRPDTLFGATFLVISPEHPLLIELTSLDKKEEVDKYVARARKKSELERKESKDKTGIFTGSYVVHPLTQEKIPVWVADYVLSGYGTGAVMAVPAHDQRDFEFAKKFGLEIKQVIEPIGLQLTATSNQPKNNYLAVSSSQSAVGQTAVYEGDGVLINSGEFNGLSSDVARSKITDYLLQHQSGQPLVQYHLRDWSISRQRYWGTPIPIIHCQKCGMVPVPEKDLPVKLPYEVDYAPQGKPPLASNKEWLRVKCPNCEGEGERDPETMDTFVDSSWYFFRYLDPKYDLAPFEEEMAKKMMPVDIYFGGAEHNLGHTLYSRFFTKFFHDLGMTDLEEYALKRINHGIVLGPDGNKMSKSWGNVVNPDEEVKKYGADTIRVHLAFFMPYDGTGPWVPERVWGSARFLERVWNLYDKVKEIKPTARDLVLMHKTIKKVGDDIENIKFNTAVASLMEWINYLSRKEIVSKEEYQVLLKLLAPFATHLTEELWVMVGGAASSIHQQSWPEFDKKYLEEEEVVIVVQVNGRVRDQIVVSLDLAQNKAEVEKMALESPKVQKFLEGKEVKKIIYIPGKIFNIVLG